MRKIIVALLGSLFFSGCIDQSSDLSISELSNGGTYIFLTDDGATPYTGSDALPDTLRITYDSPRPNLQVFFNGSQIGPRFTIAPNYAEVAFADIKDFIREGSNKLIVEPQNIFSIGPRVTFTIDTGGPFVQPAGVVINGGNAEIVFNVADASDVTAITINGDSATLSDGAWTATTSNSPAQNLFHITGTDEHGFQRTTTYLKNGAEIEGIFKARVTNDVITGLAPLIEDAMAGTILNAENDQSGVIGTVFDTGNFLTPQVKVRELALGKANFNGMTFKAANNGSTGKVGLDIEMIPTVPYTKDNNTVSGSSYTNAEGNIATTAGSYALVDAKVFILGWQRGIALDIETVDVLGDVNIAFNHGAFDLSFNDNVQLVLGDTGSAGNNESWLTGIIGFLKDIIRPIIIDIIESTLQTNLNQIRLGARFTNDAGDAFDFSTNAQSVATDNGSMSMTYNGSMNIVDPADELVKSLGSIYEASPIGDYLSSPGGVDSNLQVNVNSNVINQGFNTVYSIGMTHITGTFADQQIHFGPNAIGDDAGSDGDRKLELIPAGPGAVVFSGSNTNQADLSYRNATMILSEKRDGAWEEVFFVNADITAGVLMEAKDTIMGITINKSPNLQVNRLVQKGPLLSVGDFDINVPDDVLLGLVDFAVDFIYPQLSNTELLIDIPDLETEPEDGGSVIRSSVTTDAFETTSGHLKFNMSINPEVN
ncbi:Uncharacterised protein [BD1-7 clade bacterium]|uniref:Uncharacterized protein n=1 Tax=BD1-7 clade bacterium TaxID=2029982 RepID=A0A5S9Q4C7_9GAMM|nr:Uncharacterised protein [BD1-7 clade bacterium]CAA0112544.1 Uncharacterised protein [BD1-7 clade bacterium]